MNWEMALLLFSFSLIWNWTEWYDFHSRLNINELKWLCALRLQRFRSHNLHQVKHRPSEHLWAYHYTHTQKVRPDTPPESVPMGCSWDMLNFTLTRATAWPLVQHRRHSFSSYVIFHSQPPRSGHLKPGWSRHFVCWACVSSPASRAEAPGPQARIFVSW